MKGVVLGGTASGVGKTVATLTVTEALRREGYEVQPAKAGPDFIDPSQHRAVAGRPSRTLDCWLEGVDGLRRNYHRGEGDVCVVEGVMGLYDGDASSTAMVAGALDLPVVLVVDATAGMESVGATALGFREYADRAGREVDVAGVLVQQAHGGRHAEGIREALPEELTYCGRIPPDGDLSVPDRHLGLHMGTETTLPEDALAAAAETVRVDRLLSVAEPAARPETEAGERAAGHDRAEPEERPTVAVARDAAFAFLYPRVLSRLRELAEVRTVSPVAGDDLGPVDAVYLPGGYPELHLDALAESPTLSAVADRAAGGLPVYGECGGLMALCRSVETAEGERAELPGVIPADVEMHDRYQALDHVALRATADNPLLDAGATVRGHEFHYSAVTVDGEVDHAFEVERGDGVDGDHDGLTVGRTVGTYCHTHVAHGVVDQLVATAGATDV